MHVRDTAVRQSGAILGTIAGTATVTVGLVGSANTDLRPAALFVLGIWWWTIGKLWAETGVLPRALGSATAVLGALALAAGVFSSFAVVPAVYVRDLPILDPWTPSRVILGGWLLAMAAVLYRTSSAVPSR